MDEKRIAESELIINPDGSVFHLHLLPEDIADTILLFGDQSRVDMTAEMLDEGSITVNKSSREFHTITGRYNGKKVTLMSSGIGTDNIDIVMNELDALVNIDFTTRTVKPEHRTLTILRVGTCGCIQPDIPLGAYIYSEMSVGFDGVLNWYADFGDVTDFDMEMAFIDHMDWPDRLATPYFAESSRKLSALFDGFAYKGITMSAPGFYGPQGRSVRLNLTIPNLVDRLGSFRYGDLRITNIEMESSALQGLATLLGHEAGTICLAIANRYAKESNPDYKKLMKELLSQILQKLF
jgi:Uridine phosphorylase